jgi:UDP-GlcNAc:undecaprenyl-phosphate/decaprenyl-phosphate GlcNAc-1-phosphate transferase
MNAWLLTLLIAFLTSVVATRLIIGLGIRDVPDEARKNHTKTTPTSGGLGIISGTFAATGYCIWSGAMQPNLTNAAVLIMAMLGGLLGLVDDVRTLGSKRKLAMMLVISGAFVAIGGRIEALQISDIMKIPLGTIVGGLGTLLWLLVIVNTINFMDGANGMAMGCAGLGLLGLSALSGIRMASGGPAGDDFAVLGWIGFGAILGFLVWNAPRGAIFAGDCGALFVGLLSGALGVLAVMAGINPLCVALCFLPMLTDVILTIIRRLRRGDNVLTAHSEHAYQKAIRAGASHLYTSWRYWLQTGFTISCALFAQHKGGWWPLGLFVGATLFLALIYMTTLQSAARAQSTT